MPVSGPNWEPDEKYYDCRYAVLREPLGFPRGAEILADDDQAIHAWVEDGDKIVAVGRAHVIPESSDGSQADHAGPGAAQSTTRMHTVDELAVVEVCGSGLFTCSLPRQPSP